jgi:lipoprotein NlpI
MVVRCMVIDPSRRNDAMRNIVPLVSVFFLLIGVAAAKADDTATCNKGSGDETIAACTRVISSNKFKGQNLSIIFVNRGNAYHGKGDHDRAIADHSEAIRIEPKYGPAYNGRGNTYHSQGNYDRAIADYGEAVRLDPKFATGYSNRGVSYFRKGDYDRAIADFDGAIRLNPKYVVAINGRGNA